MQLQNLKKTVSNSIKKISNSLHKEKNNSVIKILFIVFMAILIILTILLFFNFSSLYKSLNLFDNKDSNFKDEILKIAEEEYEKGYLENSSLNYQKYLKNDLKKSEKILAYKRLFEINILQKNNELALSYLDKIQEIDKKILETYINRIKIYLRMNDLEKAKIELKKNSNKFINSPEFQDLYATYYFKLNDNKQALKSLESIKYNKRDYYIHKKIIISFIKLKKYDEAMKYIIKIEKKLLNILDEGTKAEFFLLKAIVKIYRNDFINLTELLNQAKNLNKKYTDISNKFIIFGNMYLDQIDEVYDLAENNEDRLLNDNETIKMLGDYFIYKSDFKKALYFYLKLQDKKELSKDELTILVDLYFLTDNYQKSIDSMEKLFIDYKYNTSDIYKNLSYCYGSINDLNNEIFFLKEGLSNYPKDIEFYLRLAKIYIDNNQHETSLDYIERARDLYSKSDNYQYYKSKFESLRVKALEKDKNKIKEKDLLDLREDNQKSIESYFKLIDFYLKNHNYKDAKREIDTVLNISMEEKQNEILNNYLLIYNLASDKNEDYKKNKDYLFKIQEPAIKTTINKAVCDIIEGEYDNALLILDNINSNNLNNDLKSKLTYLKAVCYYYKEEYLLSLKLIKKEEDNNMINNKINYLKSLILNRIGEKK